MISELQEALHTKETELINAHEEEVAVLRQQLTTEKERARKVSCEHAAEQDATITACEEEIATLKESGSYKHVYLEDPTNNGLQPWSVGFPCQRRKDLLQGNRFVSQYNPALLVLP